MAGERWHPADITTHLADLAATEPRPDGRGEPDRDSSTWAGQPTAATEPRPDGRGEIPIPPTGTIPLLPPQRSPGLMAGERSFASGHRSRSHPPQRSPGLMAGERGIAVLLGGGLSSGRNGAPA